MLPVWIVYASNFDLNIPECHIRDSSHIRFYWSTVSRHETITVSISICVTDPYSCVCHLCAFVRMCACACVCVCVCVYAHVSSSALYSMSRYTAVVVHLIHIQVWRFLTNI